MTEFIPAVVIAFTLSHVDAPCGDVEKPACSIVVDGVCQIQTGPQFEELGPITRTAILGAEMYLCAFPDRSRIIPHTKRSE